MISTVQELARLERGVLSGALFPPHLVAAMLTPGSLAGYNGVDNYDAYGLGMMRFTTKCGRAWGHRGRILGYTTWMLSTVRGTRTAVAFVNVGELTSPLTRRTNTFVMEALCS